MQMYVVHLRDFDCKKCIVWVGGGMPPVGVGFGMLVDFLGQKNYTHPSRNEYVGSGSGWSGIGMWSIEP